MQRSVVAHDPLAGLRDHRGGLYLGTLFALTVVTDLLPTSWRNDVVNYLPANAGSQIITVIHTRGALGPWTGLGVLTLYGAAALTAATVLITRRDA